MTGKTRDSGHWEERRKIEASSIEPAVAGLQALRLLFGKGGLAACQFGNRIVALDDIDRLIERVSQALTSHPSCEMRPIQSENSAVTMRLCFYGLSIECCGESEIVCRLSRTSRKTSSETMGFAGIWQLLLDSRL